MISDWVEVGERRRYPGGEGVAMGQISACINSKRAILMGLAMAVKRRESQPKGDKFEYHAIRVDQNPA